MASAFDVKKYVQSKFGSVGSTEEELRSAANAIIADYSEKGYLGNLGGTRPQIWAQQALNALNNTSGDTSQNLTVAREWLTGAKQPGGAARELQRYASTISDLTKKIANVNENYANETDFSNPTLTSEFKTAAQAKADKYLAENQSLFDQADIFGIDTKTNLRRTSAGFTATKALDANQTAQRDRQLAIEKAAGVVPTATAPSESVMKAFAPTAYSDSAKLTDLQKTVMGTNAGLSANKDFINGVFKAFHNRNATAEELKAYEGKKVGDVRTEIVGGAQAAGLPTVAQGTVNVPTGVLTPAQATEQGLQKVLRPDQLSAFREDQIVRDNLGGIYLKTETTTQAQRDAVASGKSGSSIATVAPAIVGSPTASATDLETASTAPDAAAFSDTFANSDSATPSEMYDAITTTTNSFLDSITAGYDKQIAAIQSKIDAGQANLDTLTGRISALSTATPNADALARASELEGLKEKQAKITEIKAQIVAEQERLNLGMIQESNKLAPLSIIGNRQATLQAQGLARIGALSAIAQVYQDDLDFAKSMVDATVTAMNADRTLQLNALDTLITLAENKIVNLTSEENAMIAARSDALTTAMDNAQKDADNVFDLIKENPEAAVLGKVSLSDSAAVALSKMAPYMAAAEAAKAAADALETQVVDLGGYKALIDSKTGETISTYEETLAPGSGTNYKDVTREDNSIVRIFTDANGYPTGEEITLMTADDSKKLEEFNTAVGDWQSKMNSVDADGNPGATWEQARASLQSTYSEVSQDKIDAVLAGATSANPLVVWFSDTLDGAVAKFPGLQREIDYWKGQGWDEEKILKEFKYKYRPNFSQDLSTSQNGSTGKIVSLKLGDYEVQVSDTISRQLARADADYFAATGKHIRISEGLRSRERQAELYERYRSGQGGRAAPPGESFHETGKAIDVSGDWKAAEPYLHKYGFRNDLADDRHHFSIGEFS